MIGSAIFAGLTTVPNTHSMLHVHL